jgi:hypothetical protein
MRTTLLLRRVTFLILLLFVVSCQKQKLTEETHEGANTFSCLVNRNAFNTCPKSFFGIEPISGGIVTSSYTSKISAGAGGHCGKTHENVFVYIDSFYGVGEYPLIYPYNEGVCNTDYFNEYSTRYTNNGKVVITYFDRWNGILSGTFEFVASKSAGLSDKVTVTRGRFDIKF